jgi:hypothetical protein
LIVDPRHAFLQHQILHSREESERESQGVWIVQELAVNDVPKRRLSAADSIQAFAAPMTT